MKNPIDFNLFIENQNKNESPSEYKGLYLKINTVELHGEEESEEYKGIFPSDHYGLCSEIEIKYL